MEWWEIYVQVPEIMSEAIAACLHRLHSRAVVLHESAVLDPHHDTCLETNASTAGWIVVQGAWPDDAALGSRLRALQEELHAWTEVVPGLDWRLYCRLLRDHDYLTYWRRFFSPVTIAGRLLIRPSWETTPVPPGMLALTLEPGMAFGTGLHATTQLCLTMLATALQGEQEGCLLDVGCGSGILSLAALRLGMARALGVDIDPLAIPVARRNAALNGLQDRVQFFCGSLDAVRGRFAFITANLYLEPLLQMATPLAECLLPGGTAILSGILEEQEAPLRHALQVAHLQVYRRLLQDGWVALGVRHGGE